MATDRNGPLRTDRGLSYFAVSYAARRKRIGRIDLWPSAQICGDSSVSAERATSHHAEQIATDLRRWPQIETARCDHLLSPSYSADPFFFFLRGSGSPSVQASSYNQGQ